VIFIFFSLVSFVRNRNYKPIQTPTAAFMYSLYIALNLMPLNLVT